VSRHVATSDAAIDALWLFHWPGNAREQERPIERTVALTPSHPIDSRVRDSDRTLGAVATVLNAEANAGTVQSIVSEMHVDHTQPGRNATTHRRTAGT
jgi:DNA-binding NtrC family response regulator